MRILSVCGGLGRGGTERVVQNFSMAYKRAGHAVAVLAHHQGGRRQATLEAAGIPVFGAGGDIVAALRDANAFQPDLIHIHRPGVRNDRETEILRRLRRPDRRVIETSVFARIDYSSGADLIDVHMHLTEWCLWRWRRWLGSETRKRVGVVVPNAVEPTDFTPSTPEDRRAFRESLDIPSDAYVCGRVGQSDPTMWHPQIFQSFGSIAQRDPHAFLLLVGLPEALRPAVDSLPDHIRQRVRSIGLIDSDAKLSRVYSAMDCFLHCARQGESFGMAITEAMLCGTPVVTCSRPHKNNSQVVVVEHLKTGLVAGSLEGLSAAALRLHSDATLRARCHASARQSVIDRFAADRVAAMAAEIGQTALETSDRSQLQRKFTDKGYQRDVSFARIQQLLHRSIGPLDLKELCAMRLLHLPLTHRGVYSYLRWKYYRKLPAQTFA